MIMEYNVNTLGEYFDSIHKIKKYFYAQTRQLGFPRYGRKKPSIDAKISLVPVFPDDQSFVLWFRGQECRDWSLVPSLYRAFDRTPYSPDAMKAAEQMRLQHYAAKNTHQMPFNPRNELEWMELMQHHGTKTRLLDWSESSISSLLFALERITDAKKCDSCKRKDYSPVVWVTAPQMLNRSIAVAFANNKEARVKNLEMDVKRHLIQMDESHDYRLRYLYNLSDVINDLKNRGNAPHEIEYGEFYPVYYHLLLEYYYHSTTAKDDQQFPPLSIVQPYHNDRIRTQRGVFMLYPIYNKQDDCKFDKTLLAEKFCAKINILRPDSMVRDLASNGIHRSWLYPEAEIVSGEIENL